MNNTLLIIVAIPLYLLGAWVLFRRLSHGIEADSRNKAIGLGLAAIASLGHGFLLYNSIHGTAQLNLSFFTVLSLTAWLVTIIVVTTSFRRPLENLAIFILPMSAISLGLQELIPPQVSAVKALQPGLEMHIMLSLIAYSLLSVAVLQSLLLFIQNHQLRNRHPGGFIRALPPLETMETLLFQFIGLGYLVLSLALVTGVTYIENIFEQHLVHKTVLSIIAWGVFGMLLWGRWRFGWRGRTAIRWTLAGFLVLMLSYFGSKLVLELVLG